MPGQSFAGPAAQQFGAPVSLFSSDREQRLWARTRAVVVAIYSTLALAGTLAGAVSQDLLAAGVLLCMLLVLATIVTQGLRARPGGAEIGIALGIASRLHIGVPPDERFRHGTHPPHGVRRGDRLHP